MKPNLCFVTAAFVVASAHATYTVRELTSPSGISGTAYAYGVNNSGLAVGYVQTTSAKVAAKWSISTSISSSTVGTLSGYASSVAYGVNNSGEIVGGASSPTTATDIGLWAFYCSSTGATSLLPSIASDSEGLIAIPSIAYSIDDAHNIVGTMTRYHPGSVPRFVIAPPFAFIGTAAGTPKELPPKPTTSGFYPVGAYGYHVVTNTTGSTTIAGGAGYWDPISGDQYLTASNTSSAMSYMDPLGDIYSWEWPSCAYGSNVSGTIVGYVDDGSGTSHFPFVRSGGTTTLLTSSNGEARSHQHDRRYCWLDNRLWCSTCVRQDRIRHCRRPKHAHTCGERMGAAGGLLHQ